MANIIPLISAEQINFRLHEIGQDISAIYSGKSLVLVCILKGSFIFTADLARHINIPISIDFLGTKSYEGSESSGIVQITHDLTSSIKDKNVLIIEDIIDTGLTITHILNLLKLREPESIRICSLLHKPARTKVPVKIDFRGFTIDDQFVVGYGLDYDEQYRNLPFIGSIRK